MAAYVESTTEDATNVPSLLVFPCSTPAPPLPSNVTPRITLTRFVTACHGIEADLRAISTECRKKYPTVKTLSERAVLRIADYADKREFLFRSSRNEIPDSLTSENTTDNQQIANSQFPTWDVLAVVWNISHELSTGASAGSCHLQKCLLCGFSVLQRILALWQQQQQSQRGAQRTMRNDQGTSTSVPASFSTHIGMEQPEGTTSTTTSFDREIFLSRDQLESILRLLYDHACVQSHPTLARHGSHDSRIDKGQSWRLSATAAPVGTAADLHSSETENIQLKIIQIMLSLLSVDTPLFSSFALVDSPKLPTTDPRPATLRPTLFHDHSDPAMTRVYNILNLLVSLNLSAIFPSVRRTAQAGLSQFARFLVDSCAAVIAAASSSVPVGGTVRIQPEEESLLSVTYDLVRVLCDIADGQSIHPLGNIIDENLSLELLAACLTVSPGLFLMHPLMFELLGSRVELVIRGHLSNPKATFSTTLRVLSLLQCYCAHHTMVCIGELPIKAVLGLTLDCLAIEKPPWHRYLALRFFKWLKSQHDRHLPLETTVALVEALEKMIHEVCFLSSDGLPTDVSTGSCQLCPPLRLAPDKYTQFLSSGDMLCTFPCPNPDQQISDNKNIIINKNERRSSVEIGIAETSIETLRAVAAELWWRCSLQNLLSLVNLQGSPSARCDGLLMHCLLGNVNEGFISAGEDAEGCGPSDDRTIKSAVLLVLASELILQQCTDLMKDLLSSVPAIVLILKQVGLLSFSSCPLLPSIIISPSGVIIHAPLMRPLTRQQEAVCNLVSSLWVPLLSCTSLLLNTSPHLELPALSGLLALIHSAAVLNVGPCVLACLRTLGQASAVPPITRTSQRSSVPSPAGWNKSKSAETEKLFLSGTQLLCLKAVICVGQHYGTLIGKDGWGIIVKIAGSVTQLISQKQIFFSAPANQLTGSSFTSSIDYALSDSFSASPEHKMLTRHALAGTDSVTAAAESVETALLEAAIAGLFGRANLFLLTNKSLLDLLGQISSHASCETRTTCFPTTNSLTEKLAAIYERCVNNSIPMPGNTVIATNNEASSIAETFMLMVRWGVEDNSKARQEPCIPVATYFLEQFQLIVLRNSYRLSSLSVSVYISRLLREMLMSCCNPTHEVSIVIVMCQCVRGLLEATEQLHGHRAVDVARLQDNGTGPALTLDQLKDRANSAAITECLYMTTGECGAVPITMQPEADEVESVPEHVSMLDTSTMNTSHRVGEDVAKDVRGELPQSVERIEYRSIKETEVKQCRHRAGVNQAVLLANLADVLCCEQVSPNAKRQVLEALYGLLRASGSRLRHPLPWSIVTLIVGICGRLSLGQPLRMDDTTTTTDVTKRVFKTEQLNVLFKVLDVLVREFKDDMYHDSCFALLSALMIELAKTHTVDNNLSFAAVNLLWTLVEGLTHTAAHDIFGTTASAPEALSHSGKLMVLIDGCEKVSISLDPISPSDICDIDDVVIKTFRGFRDLASDARVEVRNCGLRSLSSAYLTTIASTHAQCGRVLKNQVGMILVGALEDVTTIYESLMKSGAAAEIPSAANSRIGLQHHSRDSLIKLWDESLTIIVEGVFNIMSDAPASYVSTGAKDDVLFQAAIALNRMIRLILTSPVPEPSGPGTSSHETSVSIDVYFMALRLATQLCTLPFAGSLFLAPPRSTSLWDSCWDTLKCLSDRLINSIQLGDRIEENIRITVSSLCKISLKEGCVEPFQICLRLLLILLTNGSRLNRAEFLPTSESSLPSDSQNSSSDIRSVPASGSNIADRVMYLRDVFYKSLCQSNSPDINLVLSCLDLHRLPPNQSSFEEDSTIWVDRLKLSKFFDSSTSPPVGLPDLCISVEPVWGPSNDSSGLFPRLSADLPQYHRISGTFGAGSWSGHGFIKQKSAVSGVSHDDDYCGAPQWFCKSSGCLCCPNDDMTIKSQTIVDVLLLQRQTTSISKWQFRLPGRHPPQ